jgi:threonine dehydrogenase-like Zn-dependent dehydrogenase
MTELVVEEERYLVRVPRCLADVGVLVEPLTIPAKAAGELEAIVRRYPWEVIRFRALVLGAGPIGLLGAMMCVARGFDTVVYSRGPADSDRAELTRSFGAEYVSARDIPLPELSSRLGTMDVVMSENSSKRLTQLPDRRIGAVHRDASGTGSVRVPPYRCSPMSAAE